MDDIEQKFFEIFEIEPYKSCCACNERNIGCLKGQITRQNCNSEAAYIYPEITDRILLELMEILLKQELQEFYYEDDTYLFTSKLKVAKRITCNKCANLKELILHTAYALGQFRPLKDGLTKPIQSLFAEEE